jgi:hypothetical protein
MSIQNSRTRAKLRKEKMMEQQEAAVQTSQNGVEKNVPPVTQESDLPVMQGKNVQIKTLQEKREKFFTMLNQLKAERDAMSEELQMKEDNIKRQEGAVLMLDQLLREIDPPPSQPNPFGGVGGG